MTFRLTIDYMSWYIHYSDTLSFDDGILSIVTCFDCDLCYYSWASFLFVARLLWESLQYCDCIWWWYSDDYSVIVLSLLFILLLLIHSLCYSLLFDCDPFQWHLTACWCHSLLRYPFYLTLLFSFDDDGILMMLSWWRPVLTITLLLWWVFPNYRHSFGDSFHDWLPVSTFSILTFDAICLMLVKWYITNYHSPYLFSTIPNKSHSTLCLISIHWHWPSVLMLTSV